MSTPIQTVPRSTPWGAIQHQTTIAPGIIQVSTASHGGIWLSDDRWQALKAIFPALQSWAGENWLEEDCDWKWAALAFPDEFRPKDVWHAWHNIPDSERAHLPANAQNIAEAFHATAKDKWQVGSCGGGAGGSWFSVYHITTGERRTFKGNPPAWDGLISSAELANLAAA